MHSARTTARHTWPLLAVLMIIMSFAVPVQAQGEPTGDEEGQQIDGMTVEAVIRFREELGFRADRPHVERLQTAPEFAESRQRWPMGMTPEEEREFQFRLDLQLATGDLVEHLPSRYQDYFGGLFIDQPAGGIVNVSLVKGTPPEVPQEIRRSFEYPQNVRFTTVDYTFKELRDLEAAVWNDADEFGITMTNVNEWKNRLDVAVAGDPTGVAEQLAERHNVPVEAILVFQGEVEPNSRTDGMHHPPARAGLQINAAGRGSCTSGFVVERSIGVDAGIIQYDYFMLTAAHCANVRETVTHDTDEVVGVTTNDRRFGGYVDAILIDIPESNASNWIYLSAGTNGGATPIAGMQTRFEDGNGATVCASALVTGHQCGTVLHRNVTHIMTDEVTGVTASFQNTRVASFGTQRGDSGGPTYWPTSAGRYAAGVVHGRLLSGQYADLMLYSHIEHVRNSLGGFSVTRTNRGWAKNPAYAVQDAVKGALD